MMPSEELAARLTTDDQRASHTFIYEVTRDPVMSTLILAALEWYAANNQQATFWEAMKWARSHYKTVPRQ